MLRAVPAVVAVAGLAASSFGQALSWAAAVSGNWGTAANWNPANVPDAVGESATLGLMGAYAVSVAGGFAVDSLTIANPDAALDISPGSFIALRGGLANDGLVRVNLANLVAQTSVRFDASAAITGTGTIRLGSPSNRAEISRSSAGVVVTHGSGHTIDGFGRIITGMINDGLISANVSGQALELIAPITNNSRIEAVNGGTISVGAVTITQPPTGLLTADGGTLSFVSSTIDGGIIEEAPIGTTTFTGTSTVDGVLLTGTPFVAAGSVLAVRGGLDLTGELVINPANLVAQTELRFDESASLGGGGTVRLASPSNRAQVSRINGTITPTQDAGNAIRGFGRIVSGLLNNGVIAADVPGQTLELSIANITNNAAIFGENSGILQISGITVTQPTGLIAANGGRLDILNATILGGDIAQALNETIEFRGTTTLDAVTLTGDTSVPGGNFTIVRNSITNNGELTVNPTNLVAPTAVRFDTSGSLLGGGVLRLGSPVNRAELTRVNGTVIVTNSANHSIRGFGRVLSGLVNDGLVAADVAGQTLELTTAGITNNARMEAGAGATLLISSITVDQAAGGGEIVANGTLNITSATINSGTLEQSPGGSVVFNGTSIIDDVQIINDAAIVAGSLLIVRNDLTHDGVLTINPTNAVVQTTLRVDTISSTFSGGGTLRLGSPTNRAQLTRVNGTVIVTNAADHTIDGFGQILSGMTNNGLVHANVMGQTLQVAIGAITNNAVLQASNGATLSLESPVTQSASGRITADAGNVSVSNTTVTSGTVDGQGGSVTFNGTCTINGVTFDAPASLVPGGLLLLTGPFTNNARFGINPAGAIAQTTLRADTDVTFTGTGELFLGGSNNLAQITRVNGTVDITNGPDHTISGFGSLLAPITNDGTIAPGNNGVGTMTASQPITFTDSGVYAVDLSGAPAGNDLFTTTSSVALDGTINVARINGFAIPTTQRVFTVMTSSTSGISGAFDRITGEQPVLPLVLRVANNASTVQVGYVCLADYAVPFGTLDINDILIFADGFNTMNPASDLFPAGGDGVFDINDILTFATAFNTPCP